MDNRPVKANKFGGRGGRFSAASRLQQQRAVREAGAKGQPEVQKGGKMSLQAQRKQPWQNYGRENQRVGAEQCNFIPRNSGVLRTCSTEGRVLKLMF